MDAKPITARRYTDFAEMKADEYRYWAKSARARTAGRGC